MVKDGLTDKVEYGEFEQSINNVQEFIKMLLPSVKSGDGDKQERQDKLAMTP